MKKCFRNKVICLLITISLMVPYFNAAAVFSFAQSFITNPESVKGSNYTSSSALATELDAVFAGDIDIYTDSNCSNEVKMPVGSRMSMSTQYYVKSKTTGNNASGWQCYIYANAVYNKLFKEWVGHGGSFAHSRNVVSSGINKLSYDILKNAGVRSGAYVRTTTNSSGAFDGNSGHSFIILSYNESQISYIEGNGDAAGLIRITNRSWDELNNIQLSGAGRYIAHIVQPTDAYYDSLYGNEESDVDFVHRNILQADAPSSNNYISGTWYSLTNGSGRIRESGCGIVSMVSAIYNLGNSKIQKANIGSVIDEVFDWAYSKGYWTGSAGTYWSMFPNADDKFGEKYGFKVSGQYGSSGSESTSLTALVEHLKNKNGTAVVHVYNHYMVVADYKVENGKEKLLVFDPLPGSGTYYTSSNRRNVTSAAGDWFEISKLQRDGGSKGSQGSDENIEIDGYWLVYPLADGDVVNSNNPDMYSAPTRVLYYNESNHPYGDDVKWVQSILLHLGYSLPIDGGYGPTTSQIIREFQSKYSLDVDGKVGPQSIAKLGSLWSENGHTWESLGISVAPSCSEDGKEEFKCRYCEATKIETISGTGEHFWNDGNVVSEPNCAENGLAVYTCQFCNETKNEIIAKISEHSWNDGNLIKKPSCNEDGCVEYICLVCGENNTVAVDKLGGHIWDDGVITTPATSTTEGVLTHTCGVCSATKTESIPKLDVDKHVAGDIDGDGDVDMDDAHRLMQYIAGQKVYVNIDAIDTNNDGKTNNKDVMRLLKYINGENVEIY